MAHAQKPHFVFRRNGRVHLNRRGRQFSRLLAGEVCASAVVMLDTPCSEVVWIVVATHSIRQFPPHFPSRSSPCAITFQLDSNTVSRVDQHLPAAVARLFHAALLGARHCDQSCRLQERLYQTLFWWGSCCVVSSSSYFSKNVERSNSYLIRYGIIYVFRTVHRDIHVYIYIYIYIYIHIYIHTHK